MPGNSNSGRKTDWFKLRCAEMLGEYELVDFVGRVAAGKETEERLVVTKLGHQIVRVEADISDRLTAFKMLAEWGIGKPGLIASAFTPEDSKRTADEYFQSIKRLEEDALNRFRTSAIRP